MASTRHCRPAVLSEPCGEVSHHTAHQLDLPREPYVQAGLEKLVRSPPSLKSCPEGENPIIQCSVPNQGMSMDDVKLIINWDGHWVCERGFIGMMARDQNGCYFQEMQLLLNY
ncbi:hypothetical protein ACOSQ4_031089 [Xanthoceras sorbifolium]